MTLAETLVTVWQQALVNEQSTVGLGRRRVPVEFTKAKHLRTVAFAYRGHKIFGIEQNPRTSSRWAKLARQGKRIMQFSHAGRYVANVCEGKIFRYPSWRTLKLPG